MLTRLTLFSFFTLCLISVLTYITQAQHHNKATIASGFTMISDMYVSPSGLIYVTDSQRNYLYRIHPTSAVIDSMGGRGQSSTQFYNPTGIDATNDLKIYVLDGGNGRIQMFDRRFQHLGTISIDFQHGSENRSVGLTVNSRNEIRFWDGVNRQVRGFSSTYFLDQQFRPNVRSVRYPIRRIRSFPDGFAIIDATGSYIHRYSHDGRYLGFWSIQGSAIDIAYNSDHIFILTENEIQIVSETGHIEGTLNHNVIGAKHIGFSLNYIVVASDTALYRVVY